MKKYSITTFALFLMLSISTQNVWSQVIGSKFEPFTYEELLKLEQARSNQNLYQTATPKLQLYGGQNHDEYLGCLNCSSSDPSSIWNEFGTYGNSYNSKSIWNEYGTFGNEYNSYSPWNSMSNHPPVVVDKEGNFYGYFTVNEFKSNRAEFKLALIIYQYHSLIREDVGDWYDNIFE